MSNNSIALAETYLPLLDEVYKNASKTSVLDVANSQVKFNGGNAVEIFKTSMNGLGNYSRNNGFVGGDVTGTWEKLTLSKDRARSFMIDAMDNEETLGMAFGTLASEFLRTKVVPEIDAYRISKMAGTSGILSANGALTTSANVLSALSTAEQTMNDKEVPEEGRIMFVSNAVYELLKGGITRTIENGATGIAREIEVFDGMRVIKVPSTRFNTAITLYDGTTSGQTDGGYVATAGGYPINFLIVHPSAVVSVIKHEKPRIFSPDVNQSADAWKFDYRLYHDLFVLDNKKDGIYLHRGTTANQ